MTDERATIVAPGPDCSPAARVTWTAQEVTIRDGNGRSTVLRNGVDVQTIVLRRTLPADGTAPGTPSSWTLDLMKGTISRARLHSPPWDFDRDHGPAEAARVSGLPLVERAPVLDSPPAPVEPRPHGPALRLTLLSVIIVPLIYCVLLLVAPLREQAWSWAAVTALSLPILLWVQLPAILRRLGLSDRGEVVFRARPSTILRSSAGSAIVRRRDLLMIRTRQRSSSLPLPDDACGPVELRPAAWDDGEPAELLMVRSASGHTLATLLRSEWCSDDSEAELAAAFGVPFNREPVTADVRGAVASVTARTDYPGRLLTLVSLTGPATLVIGLSTDQGVASVVAVVLGALNTLLGLGGGVARVIADFWHGRGRRPRRRRKRGRG